MNKKMIKISESDLHHIVMESVNRLLKENIETDVIKKLYEKGHISEEVMTLMTDMFNNNPDGTISAPYFIQCASKLCDVEPTNELVDTWRRYAEMSMGGLV